MKCPKCQYENPNEAKFCGSCGGKLTLICPQCGFENTPGNRFCNECGHKLTKTKVPSTVDYSEPQSYTPKHLKDKILTIRSKSYYNQIRVDQLTLKSSTELVLAMLEGGEVVPELRDIILNRAAGNPLYIEELTRAMLENGSIEKRDHLYALSEKAAVHEIPDSIQGIIAARIDRLEENLKRIMQVASVIGRDFAFRVLQRVIDMREELKLGLLNLQGLEFIYEKQIFPELEYIFKHALIQEVANDTLLLMRRKELHEKNGKSIEELYSQQLDEFYELLAYHYSKSENYEKAYHYFKKSGEKAGRYYASQEALNFYKQAAQALEQQPISKENKRKLIELIKQISDIMGFLSFPEDALAFFYSRMASLYSFKGESQTALEYAGKSNQKVEKSGDLDLMVQAQGAL